MYFLFLLAIAANWMMIGGHPANRPIIGVVLETTDPKSTHPCGQYSQYMDYKQWIEQAGGGAVPFFVNQSDEYVAQMMTRINGVIFPGGGVDPITSPYGDDGYKIFKLANKKNDGGSYFPIWGTCLGMQEMSTWPLWPIRFNPLSNCTGMHGVNLALNFTHQATKSRLFRSLPDYIKKVLRTENVTPNFHNYCLTVKTYERFSELRRFYRVSTINDDVNGLQFVSTMEAYRYPYYGIQYHPEKINFMFAKYADSINRSADAILISQSFANFFIAEARKSQQSFKSFEEEGRFLFDNFKLNYSPTSQTPKYCFNDSDVPRFDP